MRERIDNAIAALGVAAVIFLLFCLPFAQAHENGHQDPNGWHARQYNKLGGQCCQGDDFYRTTYRVENGRYIVLIKNRWVPVPDHAVLTGPSPESEPIVWYFEGEGQIGVRCFHPGAAA